MRGWKRSLVKKCAVVGCGLFLVGGGVLAAGRLWPVVALRLDPPPSIPQVQSDRTNHAMIINQVRGQECCQAGSLEFLQDQVQIMRKLQIPAYFTLRYDALVDEKYVETVKRGGEWAQPGLFLEITPQLAAAAGVEYRGTEESWHLAPIAYPLGYSLEERRRLIDTSVEAFSTAFGSYPRLTTAWMIDADSLHYLQEKYGVRVHQLTREQWRVDSYSLWGGPPHYPYPASQGWPLIPDYTDQGGPLIVRQTVTDPVRNYGDSTSSFTSQPNDFARGGLTRFYSFFLINQAFSQPARQPGFALLGLENSMPAQDQAEYHQQLEYLGVMRDQGAVTFPTLNELVTTWRLQPMTLYGGQTPTLSRSKSSFYITTPSYRVRISLNGKKVIITDWRAYDANWQDVDFATAENNPDSGNENSQLEGMWVIPGVIDAGRWYNLSKKLPIFEFLLGRPEVATLFSRSASNDFTNNPSNLELRSRLNNVTGEWTRPNDSQFVFTYLDTHNNPITIRFFSDHWQVSPAGALMTWTDYRPATTRALTPSITCDQEEDHCNLAIVTDSQLDLGSTKNRAELWPARTNTPQDPSQTLVFAHNPIAIAGSNPVRVIVAPYDSAGIPVILNESPIFSSKDDQVKFQGWQPSTTQPYYFADMHSDQPTQTVVELTLPNETEPRQLTVTFTINCRAEWKRCLSNPNYLRWWVEWWGRGMIENVIKKD